MTQGKIPGIRVEKDKDEKQKEGMREREEDQADKGKEPTIKLSNKIASNKNGFSFILCLLRLF